MWRGDKGEKILKRIAEPVKRLFETKPRDGIERLVYEDFSKAGLSPDILEKAGIFVFRGGGDELKELLGYSSHDGHELTRGFLLVGFPYFTHDGKVEFIRFKLLPPIGDTKYLHPKDTPPLPYILPEVWELASKPHKPLAITEGEKKALKLLQEGLPAIALSGVWNFKANKTARDEEDRYLLRELRSFEWEGRTVFLFFDADTWTNPQVRRALFELSFKLTVLGAVVRVPLWRLSEGKGIDDYLALKENPKEALEKLTEKSRPIEELIRREDIQLVVKALAETDFSEAPEIAESLYRSLSKKLNISPKTLSKAIWRELKKKEGEREEPYTEEEVKKAEELLKDPTLVRRWLKFMDKLYLGREKEKLLIKLATLTRHFPRGLSVVLTGTASVGKSSLIEAVLKTVHPEAVEDFTRVSENYLLYRKAPLNNRIITFFEMHGTKSSAHIIRTALSEGKLKLGTVVKTDKGLEAKDIEKEANGLVILSTFASGSMDWELTTRVLKIEIAHDPELAHRVLLWKAKTTEEDRRKAEEEARIWRVVDYLIEPLPVVIPYAERLADLFPRDEERFLRDFEKVLLLIKASALLHQKQRERTERGEIIASPRDYLLVYELRDLIAESVSPIPEKVIEFLKTARELTRTTENGEPAYPTREEVKEVLKVSERTVQRYIKIALDEKLITVYGRGKKQEIIVDDIPEPINPLPQPEDIFPADILSQVAEVIDFQGSEMRHGGLTQSDANGEICQTRQDASKGYVAIQSIERQASDKNATMRHGEVGKTFTPPGKTLEIEEALYELFEEEGL